ncbi:MAG: exodeoxyribonuclease VII large subunit [Hydrogenophaga sp.]|uniref:exodeoxyribonuclease VII large subunit n=1 Tax=Hydrogenophaga sp. TaxID=1904254 RepID=UPI001D698A38|nr:exodeoxyribonuclease VII large subunit [Hydrogenophaga sp.]
MWAVGSLVRAVADTLSARFNPVAVQGEISGFSRASSGHCYFSLKDDSGQIRCAMFRRAADALSFPPRDGLRVQVRGRLDVYGPRGDLQLIVENMRAAGQGSLFEQFLRLKALLEAQGLFDAGRKRELPAQVRHVAVVTSLGAAALRDVVTALHRRVPHVAVTVFPASVQGAQAPAELVGAMDLANRYRGERGPCELILLVRGGGSLEDLWAFNDEAVVRAVAGSSLPVVVGVGHETDFTLADFAADLRAPTPTAAAELCSAPREQRLGELAYLQERLRDGLNDLMNEHAQRLDRVAAHLGRPAARVGAAREMLQMLQGRLQAAPSLWLQRQHWTHAQLGKALPAAMDSQLQQQRQRLQRSEAALSLLDPRLVLRRGYAYLTDEQGRAITHVGQVSSGDRLTATLADGTLPLQVHEPGA